VAPPLLPWVFFDRSVWPPDPSHVVIERVSPIQRLEYREERALGVLFKGGPAYRRALLATLVFAGLRIGELTALRWRDIDLAANRITVRASKTDAGLRQIDILPTLRDELATYKAGAANADPDGYVFATTCGSEPKQGNIRRRALDKAVARANEKLIEAGDVPLPEGVTPHKLRHTFASILVALGVDPGSVMDQLGHADSGFTLRVYRHGMRRDDPARRRLQALVGASTQRSPGDIEMAAHRDDSIKHDPRTVTTI
jgi:integrase